MPEKRKNTRRKNETPYMGCQSENLIVKQTYNSHDSGMQPHSRQAVADPVGIGRNITAVEMDRKRQISRRIKRPPSQCAGNEMAAGISIMVLEFYIPGVHSPGGKIPPKPYPSGSGPVRCAGAKPGSGRDPGRSPLRFQSDCRSQRWTERRWGCWKRANSSGP